MLNSNTTQWPDKSTPYTVRVSTGQDAVEVWSTQRLQFEPKEWQKDLRADIRRELQHIRIPQGHVLHALYGTPLSEFCDVENILFYNVGASAFTHLAQHGLRFERSFVSPGPPSSLKGQSHYHRYAIAGSQTGFLHWNVGRTLAQWSTLQIPRLSSGTKCALLWYAFRSQPIEILHMPGETPKQYGVRVDVMVPATETINIAGFMKPLLDGLIASFHAHNGQDLVLVSQRISQDIGQRPQMLADILCRRDRALLGTRRLVWPYRSNVQWNPGDDLCLAAELRVKRQQGSQWTISGSVFEIEAV